MFQRMKQGVYSFGSRKVHLYVEMNKLRVRIGGGFVSIDDFLD